MSEAVGKRDALSAAPTTVVITDFMIKKKGVQVCRKSIRLAQLMALITMSK